MIVDSSVLIATLLGEADSAVYIEALSGSGRKFMSSFTYLESAIVIEARKGTEGSRALAELVSVAEIEQVAFDAALAEVALDAWRRYGKGRHPAGLNIGDCASYALARVMNKPLLFKGDDFTKTDVPSAVESPIIVHTAPTTSK